MNDLLVECVRSAGSILMDHFGNVTNVRIKENQSSVVTDADVAAEKRIVELIQARFPDHSIIAEESGFQRRSPEWTWVVDPLDGTSNFAAGVPWFGVMIAVLLRDVPVLGALYLPVPDILYTCAQGAGTQRDGVAVQVTAETELRKMLVSYGLDADGSERKAREEAAILTRLVRRARNVRMTNCLVDFCYTIDGRFGGAINQSTKIWDIAAISLALKEAGGVLADFAGNEVEFRTENEPWDRNYPVVGASRAMLAQLIGILRTEPFETPE